MTCLETLCGERKEERDGVRNVVDVLIKNVSRRKKLSEAEKNKLLSELRRLKRLSITESIVKLVEESEVNPEGEYTQIGKEVKKIYGWRSKLIHGKKCPPEKIAWAANRSSEIVRVVLRHQFLITAGENVD